MGNQSKKNPQHLTTQGPQHITLRDSLVARGLKEIAQHLNTPAPGYSHPTIIGALSCPSEGFSHPEPAMRFTSFHCELTNISDATQTVREGLLLYRRSRATGQLGCVTGDGFGFPASSLHIPARTTFPPVIVELSFPSNTPVEDSMNVLSQDTSELIAHDPTLGTIISIPLNLNEQHVNVFVSPGDVKGKRILVVNDEESIRTAICAVLTLAKYQCRAVPSGLEALALLESGEVFDLLVHDVLNPHLDGASLLQRTKKNFPELPVIVASAVDERSAAVGCLQNGAYDYVRLPLDIKHFLGTVSRALADAALKRVTLSPSPHPAKVREKTSEMSDEELTTALLTNEQSGLPSDTAFREERGRGSPDLPCIAYADIDDFKRLRRELGGSELVERVLLKAIGRYLREAVKQQEGSIRAYHGGGDYFMFRALNEKAFAELIANANQRLSNSFLLIALPDGKVVRRIPRKLSKQPQSDHGLTNTGDDWKIEDLPQGSRIIAMSLDDGTIVA